MTNLKPAACAVLLMLFSIPVAQAEMSSEDIKSQLIGAEIQWWELHGQRQGGLLLRPDGSAELSVGTPETAHDTGQWFIKGNELCTIWPALRGGSKCYSISHSGGHEFVTSGGNGFKVVFTGV